MYKVRLSEFPRYFDAVGRVTGVHTARKKSSTSNARWVLIWENYGGPDLT